MFCCLKSLQVKTEQLLEPPRENENDNGNQWTVSMTYLHQQIETQ
jgi:hypothetical protein